MTTVAKGVTLVGPRTDQNPVPSGDAGNAQPRRQRVEACSARGSAASTGKCKRGWLDNQPQNRLPASQLPETHQKRAQIFPFGGASQWLRATDSSTNQITRR